MGHDVDWVDHRMSPDQADHVLAALGLVHVPVKLVIDDADDEYDVEMSSARNRWCVWVQTDPFNVCRCAQVLWWGMDETLAELFG